MVLWHSKLPKIIEVNKVYISIWCKDWVLNLYSSLVNKNDQFSTYPVLFWIVFWKLWSEWQTLSIVYLCYIVIPECGHTKIVICDFVENIITKIQKTHLVRFLGLHTELEVTVSGKCELRNRLTGHFPAYTVLNFQKVIKRLEHKIRNQYEQQSKV